MRNLRPMVATVAVCLLGASPSRAADVLLGDDVTDKLSVQINKKSPTATKHSIKLSLKDTDLVFTPGGGITDDPITDGASVVVFSATDCQCLIMGPFPTTSPGWSPSPSSGTAGKYRWKDTVSKSSGQVSAGKFKLKK